MSATPAKDPEGPNKTLTQADIQDEDSSNTCNGEETPAEDTQTESNEENRNETSIFHMNCLRLRSQAKSKNSFKHIPFFCSPKYISASMDERVQMLKEYHAELSKHRAILCSKSLIMAPLPPPIVLYSSSNNNATEKNNVKEVDSVENTYISRSGRCTKRMNYTEMSTLQDPVKIEKDPSDSEWLSKSSCGNKNQRRKRKNGNLLNASSEEGTKKQKNENKLETSTVSSNEASEMDTSPPTPTEKKRATPDPNKSENQYFGNFITRRGSRRLPVQRSESDASLNNIEEEDHKVCPICSKSFLVDEIENHASSCGEMR